MLRSVGPDDRLDVQRALLDVEVEPGVSETDPDRFDRIVNQLDVGSSRVHAAQVGHGKREGDRVNVQVGQQPARGKQRLGARADRLHLGRRDIVNRIRLPETVVLVGPPGRCDLGNERRAEVVVPALIEIDCQERLVPENPLVAQFEHLCLLEFQALVAERERRNRIEPATTANGVQGREVDRWLVQIRPHGPVQEILRYEGTWNALL